MTESQAEEILQKALFQQYLSNLEFLKNKDINLYNKINELSLMIDQNLYKEKYTLEFIKENGEFDVLNLETNSYLYGKNAKLINENFLKNIDLTTNFTFNNLIKNLYIKKNKDIEINNSKFKILDNLIAYEMGEYAKIFENKEPKSKEYEFIDKFIFFGNMLGTHLTNFQKRIGFKCCFIYENDLEIFRLSLFTTDYMKLDKNAKIVFSILDEENVLLEKINYFFREMYVYSNYNIKFYKMISVNDDIINKLIDELHLSSGSTYDYTKLLYDTFDSISKHINKYKILTSKNKKLDFSFSNEKPVILVGAGPSLDENINWLKNNQDKFIIVAIGATYKKLFENGIIPDIVTTVDPQYEALNSTHFNTQDIKLLENTIVLASINTPTKILERFNQKKLFLYEVVDTFKNNSFPYSGISIGEVSLSILLDINSKDIYLLGTDLAFDHKTGNSHFAGYINERKSFDKDSKINESLKTGNSSVEEFINVKGNKNNQVISNRMFSLSINQYVRIIKYFKKPFQNIYNLCENGAYIEGTIIKDINEVALPTISLSKTYLFDNIYKISEFGLLKEEYDELEIKLKNLDLCRKVLIEQFKKSNTSFDIFRFHNKFLVFYNFVHKNSDKLFLRIILNYFNFSIPYIYFNLNNKYLKDNDKKIKLEKVEKVFLKQVGHIIDVYERYLFQIKKD